MRERASKWKKSARVLCMDGRVVDEETSGWENGGGETSGRENSGSFKRTGKLWKSESSGWMKGEWVSKLVGGQVEVLKGRKSSGRVNSLGG